MGMVPGKRHTGARLAVVCCWWGQRGKQAHVEERWHLMGQRRDKGWSAVLLSLMDQSSCPPLCASICITEATSPRGVFWPFERPELILSYLMCVPVWAAYWSKPFSNQLHDCKALQCPCPYACPLSSIANWVAPQPDHLDICRWAALGLMSLNVEESQAAGEQGHWQLDQFPSVLATVPAGFHGKSESCQMQNMDPLQKFWIILTLSKLTYSGS